MWVPPPQIKVQQNHDSLRINRVDRIQTASRPNHDRLDSTRSEALQVISNLKSELYPYHYREVVHISYERTLIDSLQKLYKDKKARVTVVISGIIGPGSASLST